ncbi:MAG: tetratricopeptide repeat protein [Phycisphaerae bacterium]|nr:tetratricopeptide repeat protein [Phycisphaerae bacterium]NIP50920.1 tetratricopeptide repeat protein [Phycisphaerae bacterium]NIS50109.1 tetratricopeptide repeat protein [Phycisphaerae bacterium]NIU07773.1 tetratricopeptide repeat protein [Phycisphaerae bacterium]NIU55386.1 tetratricopeptide repeat protein [Phycisphaerae bacterium]
MVRRELKDYMQRLAERYELRYLQKHKGFAGIYQGIGVKVCESTDEITLTFFCPTADIDDQILEDFAGFSHWVEAGLPNAWIDALRETGINKPFNPTISHRGCMIKIDKYRMERIEVEKFLDIPEIVTRDLYEYGATDTWVCDMCKQEPATDAFLDGANASLCNRCWYEVHLAHKSQKRKSVLGPFCWTFLAIGILILASIIWGTFREPSGMDNCNEGIEALDNGSYDLAITYFTKAIRQEPNLAPAYALRANAYHNIGNYNAAIKDYTEAIRIVKPTLEELPKEQSAGIYNDRGFSYFLNNDFNHAIADYTKALQLKQDFTAAYFNRGDAYVVKQMYDDAVADYNEVIRLEPNNPQAYYIRGFAHFSKAEYDLTIADCTESIRLDPTYAVAYIERGVAYYWKNDYDQALADLTEAIRLVPNYGAAYSERGRIYYSKQEYDKAWEDVHKAQSLRFEVPPGFLNDLREASEREK